MYARLGISLTDSGKRWKSICPFHKEVDASFIVFPDGGFKCFGCGRSGTVKTLREMLGIEDEDLYPLHSIDLESAQDGRKGILLSNFLKQMEQRLSFLLKRKNLSRKMEAYDSFDRLKIEIRANNRGDDNIIKDAMVAKRKFNNILSELDE
jgi:hypothetical protein